MTEERLLNKHLLLSIVLLLMSSVGHAQSLKDAYDGIFTIGVAVNQRNVTNEAQMDLICREFNSVTAENDMKPGVIQPREGEWHWDRADRIANFCRTNGIKMRGHCLCWHSQFANWMFYDEQGRMVEKEVFYQRLRNHIHTIVKRYKDVVYCWDVVNEAISDHGGSDPYRATRAYKLCGDEFIAKAFEYAREADPEVLLFYNDYNTTNPGKRERIYQMVKKMKDAGVPIDGIGMQGHYNIYHPDEVQVDSAIVRFSELVDHIHITELDVRINREEGGQLEFSQGKSDGYNDAVKKQQEEQYDMLFKVFRRHSDVIDNVTFWNLGDRDSWLGVNNHPLLFDEQYHAKRAYYLVRDYVR